MGIGDPPTVVPISHPPARSGLQRRASLNSLAAALDYGARTVVELLVTPLLVGGLGSSLYGTWRVLWQWTGYLWATSGRSAQALQSAISHHQASKDDDLKRQYVASALVVWVLFLPLMVLVGGLGVWAAPAFLDVPVSQSTEVRLAATVLLVDALAVTVLTVPKSVLQGENLGYKRMGLSAAILLVGGGLMVLAVESGTGLVGVAAAALSTTVLSSVAFLVVVRRHVLWFGLARPRRSTLRWFLGLSSWFLAWKLVFELMTASDLLVLAGLTSTSLVSTYVLTRFAADALNAMALTVVQGVTPGIGGIIGSGDLRRAARVRREVLALTWFLTTVAGVGCVMWNRSFVSLWVGPDHYAGPVPALLIVLAAVQFAFIRSDSYVIDVTLRVAVKVILGAVSTAVAITAAVVLVGPLELGITGLCAGLIGGRLLLSAVNPLLVGRALGDPLVGQVSAAVRPVLVSTLLYAVAFHAGKHLVVESWFDLLTGAGFTAGVVAVVAATGLSPRSRSMLLRRVVSVAGARR